MGIGNHSRSGTGCPAMVITPEKCDHSTPVQYDAVPGPEKWPPRKEKEKESTMNKPNGDTPQQPQKRAIARPQMYIEVKLLDGQQYLFDLTTAEELKNELDMALKSLNPPTEIPDQSDPPEVA